jgi:glutamate N-acetyltransferase/amino-acid N-acetyltransferase
MTDWTIAHGYRFAGVHCGIRTDPDRRDLAVIASDRPAAAAGVFTQNRVVAAPVRLCRERLPSADVRGIVVCSGNANACTGERGLADARRMAELTAANLGCRPDQILVASTGVIGRHLPMPALESGIPQAVSRLAVGPAALDAAAHAILTTDTTIKVATQWMHGGLSVSGFAKGAAMIGPNLATMLAFILTDASVRPDDLQGILSRAVEKTFNCISVEGHTSTNDTVLLLANGEGPPLKPFDVKKLPDQSFEEIAGFDLLEAAVTQVCADLARMIAADAEGATKLVTIDVVGLRTDAEARQVAKTVADSALVKTALFGNDPNWGRFVSAAGYAGVPFEERDLTLFLGDLMLYNAGTPTPLDPSVAAAYLKANREVRLTFDFNLGGGRCAFYTCDLSTEYVHLNADYTT